MEELKQLQTDMMKAVTELRSYADREFTEIKKNGVAAPETKEALDRINARIDVLQAKLEKPDEKREEKADDERQVKAFDSYIRLGDRMPGVAEELKSAYVGSDPAGGYKVPPDMSGRIIQKVWETTPMRQIASVVTITTDALEGPIDRDEVTCGWVAERGTRSETNTPTIGEYRIPVFEIYAMPAATQKFLDDVSSAATWLEGKVSDKLARTQNAAFVTGNGVGKPRGFTTYTTAATADSSRTWGQIEHIASGASGAFAASNPADYLFSVEGALNPVYRNGASWMMPRAAVTAIRKFKATSTTDYLWQPGLQAGQPARLIGYPIIQSEDMPALAADSLSVAFGNFSAAYTIVDRAGLSVLRDPFTSKPYVLFYTTARTGGAVVNFDAIKLMKFASS